MNNNVTEVTTVVAFNNSVNTDFDTWESNIYSLKILSWVLRNHQ